MASGAVEKTADELHKEIQELQRQQREVPLSILPLPLSLLPLSLTRTVISILPQITERLRDPRGLRRAGLAPGGPRPIGGPRQRGVVRPVRSLSLPSPVALFLLIFVDFLDVFVGFFCGNLDGI